MSVPEQRERALNAQVVAVFNATPDALTMLRMALGHAGFPTVGGFVHEIIDGEIDLDALVREHQPRVIVYDVVPPYDAHWQILQQHKAQPALAGCLFVLTSTRKAYVERLASGDPQVFSVLDTPYDLDVVVRTVREALASGGAG
jgi:DNA-binding NarL/FixJ family response regulator